MGGIYLFRLARPGRPDLWSGRERPTRSQSRSVAIIKVWLEGDGIKKRFEVAWPGPAQSIRFRAGSPAATRRCEDGDLQEHHGASELSAIWQDPEFNPSQPALYYSPRSKFDAQLDDCIGRQAKACASDKRAATIPGRAGDLAYLVCAPLASAKISGSHWANPAVQEPMSLPSGPKSAVGARWRTERGKLRLIGVIDAKSENALRRTAVPHTAPRMSA